MPRAPMVAWAYQFYFRRVLPTVATWISGDRTGAYRYLPASVASFTDEAGMIASLRVAGFRRVIARRLTLGIVTVFVAWKD
jgi:demethylmenaquinone methyltransferase / 2-methoxy-6-polyprenyl-1,4-benzoquinol methylase